MCYPGREAKHISSYWGITPDEDPKMKKVTVEFSSVEPSIRFDIGTLTLPAGVHDAEIALSILTGRETSSDEDIWSLMESLGITREAADAAVATYLPGFLFGWKEETTVSSKATTLARPCADPALTLGVLARVKDGFYQSDRTPDYSVRHLSGTVFICCDARVPVRRAKAPKKEAV